MEAGRWPEARASFEVALALDQPRPRAHLMISELDRLAGDPRAADQRLTALVERFPNPATWVALGRLRASLGDTAAAERYFEIAERDMLADLEAGDPGHVRELVEFWLELRPGLHEARAVELARLDLDTVRRDAGAYETLAWALHKAGRSAEAITPVLAAARKNAGSPRPLWRAAIIHASAGRTAEASLFLDRALELNPNFETGMVAEAIALIQRGGRGSP